MDKEGIVWREEGTVIVQVPNTNNMSHGDMTKYDIKCINPEAKLEDQILEKRFTNPKKKIYLPDEYGLAIERFKDETVFVFGGNGFSSLNDDFLQKYGIKKGAYEITCKKIFCEMINALTKKLPGAKICMVYGASDMNGLGSTKF